MDTNFRHLLYIKRFWFSFSYLELQILLENYHNLENAFDDDYKRIIKNTELYNRLVEIKKQNKFEIVDEIIEICKTNSINYISIFDNNYPKILLETSPSPLIIFYQGDINLLSSSIFAVVGSRNIHYYSQQILNNTFKNVIELPVSIISGLANGVDGFIHDLCVKKDIKTIGVIGSGLLDKVFYPKSNLKLKNEIIKSGGLVMSQFYPDDPAKTYFFPIRNQIIAILSKFVWVVQAKIKSGSLVTANLATNFGVTVATTPANIFDKNFEGNNLLLKNGANIITELDDILQLLELSQTEINFESVNHNNLSQIEKAILDLISVNALSFDEIEECLSQNDNYKTEIESLFAIISQMELSGIIKEVENWKYIRL